MRPGNPTTGAFELLLPGLDGSNPLGFLATIGLFRLLNEQLSSAPKLCWNPAIGTWVPRLCSFTDQSDDLLDWLMETLPTDYDEHPFSKLQTLTNGNDPNQRHLELRRVVRDASEHHYLDACWAGAMTSNIVATTETSQLQTVRRDYLAGNVRSVLANTSREHLERALFHTWDYADALQNQSLHFDPGEDRRHAHQWNRPSGDPDRGKHGGMIGANRLALESFPALLAVPRSDRLQTLGFSGVRANNTRWTWPVWDVPVTFDTAISILGLPELQKLNLTEHEVKKVNARGVKAAFRARRILVGKTPNFTPSNRVA